MYRLYHIVTSAGARINHAVKSMRSALGYPAKRLHVICEAGSLSPYQTKRVAGNSISSSDLITS